MDPNQFQQSDAIEVRRVSNRGKGGRAVFAARDLAAGEVFERVPVLLIPKEQVFGDNPIARQAGISISWYVFTWINEKHDYVALSLGYGSIYNHSETPNAKYQMLLPDIMEFLTLGPIKAGEEITINYRGDGDDGPKELGFEVLETPAQQSKRPSDSDDDELSS